MTTFISQQQQKLLDHHHALQDRINNLLREIALTVGITLQISIQPSNLSLPKGSLGRHINRDAKELIDRKIKTTYKEDTRTVTRKERMQEQGYEEWIASAVDWLAPDPQERTSKTPVTTERFKVSRSDLQDFWEERIKEKTKSWGRDILNVAEQQISEAIKLVRAQLEAQTQTYKDILLEGISVSELSDTEKKQILDQQQIYLTQITGLLEQADTLAKKLPEEGRSF